MAGAQTADDWITALGLVPHPEGGYFTESYRSASRIPAAALEGKFPGPRTFSTGAYFLLRSQQFSAFHRLRADELWHFYAGSPLRLYVIADDGMLRTSDLGLDPVQNQFPQHTVSAGAWVAARLIAAAGSHDFSLCGCTVAPGFEFEDFELAKYERLSARYPAHLALIRALCKS